jgi:hypothetical protein
MSAVVPAATVFFDDFNGDALGPAWTVLRQNTEKYSVSGGQLHTETMTGDLWAATNNYTNLFIINNPLGSRDFQVTIRVAGFNPVTAYQQIALVAYDNDDNLMKCTNTYLDYQVWQMCPESGGTPSHYEDTRNASQSDFYLRLMKIRNIYQQYISFDGVTYERRNPPLSYGNGAPQYLGLIALEGYGIVAPPVPVNIDFFQVEDIPPAQTNFFDDFNGTTLGAPWLVFHENTEKYSLSGGNLHTSTMRGDFVHGSNDYVNLFVIPNRWGNAHLQVTIKVSGFNPVTNYQQIALVAYDDDANFARCCNGFIAGARNWEMGLELGGVWTGQLNSADAGVSEFYLRLVKIGNVYRQYMSLDGKYFQARNNPVVFGDGNPKFLGFIALEGSGILAPPVPVDVDFFSVERIDASPAINSLLLD